MLDSQRDLYRRIQAYELDDPSHEIGFVRHLMRQQGWSREPCHVAMLSRGCWPESELFHYVDRTTIGSSHQYFGETLLDLWPPGDLRISTDLFVKKGNYDDS